MAYDRAVECHDDRQEIVMNQATSSSLLAFLPISIFSVGFGIVAFLLAREKGRNVALWTIPGLLPVINFVCLWFFVGAANLRLERKIDQLLKERQGGGREGMDVGRS